MDFSTFLTGVINTDRSLTAYSNPSNTSRSSTAYQGGPTVRTGAKAVYASMEAYKERGRNRGPLKFPIEETKYFSLLEYARYRRIGSNASPGVGALFNVAFQREGSIALPMPSGGMVDNHRLDLFKNHFL